MDVDFRTQAIHAGYEPLDNGRAANLCLGRIRPG